MNATHYLNNPLEILDIREGGLSIHGAIIGGVASMIFISKKSKIIKEGNVDIDSMTISQLINFIRKNPSILKRPIMIEDHKMQVGYNKEEIRTFIPRAKRIAQIACDHLGMCGESWNDEDDD